MPVYTYRATAVYGSWYDGEKARGFEGHFVASLPGKITRNQVKLAKIITPIFRKRLLREHKLRVLPSQIRIRFERAEPAIVRSKLIRAEFLEMTYRGRERHAKRFLPQTFKLPKTRRRTKKRRVGKVRKSKKRCHVPTKARRRRSGRR